MKIRSLSFAQAGIVDISNALRTFLCTSATGNAQIRVDVPGRLKNRYLKIACLT
jgi:hypothetical protein